MTLELYFAIAWRTAVGLWLLLSVLVGILVTTLFNERFAKRLQKELECELEEGAVLVIFLFGPPLAGAIWPISATILLTVLFLSWWNKERKGSKNEMDSASDGDNDGSRRHQRETEDTKDR